MSRICYYCDEPTHTVGEPVHDDHNSNYCSLECEEAAKPRTCETCGQEITFDPMVGWWHTHCPDYDGGTPPPTSGNDDHIPF